MQGKVHKIIGNQCGNIFLTSLIFLAAILLILLFVILIFISEVNALLYTIKLDMYSINKSAIISVNKGMTSRGEFSYDKETYLEYFTKGIQANYHLDDELVNEDGLVQNVEIMEYKIYEAGRKDSYTHERTKDATIHSVIEVKIKPIILSEWLQDIFTFQIHEDVILNMVKF